MTSGLRDVIFLAKSLLQCKQFWLLLNISP